MISREISPPFSKTCNIAIVTGTHPDRIKIANSLHVLKKGLRLTIANYRPISLLSNLKNIFEKILYKRGFIEKYNILYPQLLL